MYTAENDTTGVRCKDIYKAQSEAKINFNWELFSCQETFTICFNYLTAHYLVTDLTNSAQGVNGKYTWLVASKSVGSVSESYTIPDRLQTNFEFVIES